MAKYENLTVSQLTVDAAAAVATLDSIALHAPAGIIVTKALTTAANANYDFTLNNVNIRPQDLVFASVSKGTDTVGPIVVTKIIPALGSCQITVKNEDSVNPLNGTVRISFLVVRLD